MTKQKNIITAALFLAIVPWNAHSKVEEVAIPGPLGGQEQAGVVVAHQHIYTTNPVQDPFYPYAIEVPEHKDVYRISKAGSVLWMQYQLHEGRPLHRFQGFSLSGRSMRDVALGGGFSAAEEGIYQELMEAYLERYPQAEEEAWECMNMIHARMPERFF